MVWRGDALSEPSKQMVAHDTVAIAIVMGRSVDARAHFDRLAAGRGGGKGRGMRLWSFSAGVEVAIVGARVLWRRVAAVPKSRNAFEAARAAWETRHDGFRVWLSEPEQRVRFDAQQLETVLVRTLVQELVGKRRLERSRDA